MLEFNVYNNFDTYYYLGIREDWNMAQKLANGDGDTEGALQVNTSALKQGDWKKMAVVVDEKSVTVYQDGVQVGLTESEDAVLLSEILGDSSIFV
ncbi:MAG: hypothetical protein V8S08_07640 [Lachnoclostridium sp.]